MDAFEQQLCLCQKPNNYISYHHDSAVGLNEWLCLMSMIKWLIDWLLSHEYINWLIDFCLMSMIKWLIDYCLMSILTDWLIFVSWVWLNDWLIIVSWEWLNDRLSDWLIIVSRVWGILGNFVNQVNIQTVYPGKWHYRRWGHLRLLSCVK